MRKTPTIGTGIALAAGGLLATTLITPTLSASAEDGESDDAPPHALAPGEAAKAPPTVARAVKCNGGATKSVRNLSIAGGGAMVFAGGESKMLPGTIKLKGPKKRKDTVSVAVSGVGVLDAGTYATANVWVDGKPVRRKFPTLFLGGANGSAGWESGTAQFCTKIGKGRHKLRIQFISPFGSSWSLHDATAHIEQNN